MPLFFLNRDITRMKTDAIVNAANTELTMGGGVCGAIFRAAGQEKMARACASLSPIETGSAVITPGFDLPARFVIHTAGPIYRRLRARSCRELLRSCYLNSLALAKSNGCRSIAFPLISSGIYNYPREEALQVAEESIREFLQDHDMEVYLLLLDKNTGDPELKARVQAYLDSLLPHEEPSPAVLQYTRESRRWELEAPSPAMPQADLSVEPIRREEEVLRREKRERRETFPKAGSPSTAGNKKAQEIHDRAAMARPAPKAAGLDQRIRQLDESFSETLLRLIDAKGRSDVDVYKRANLDRKLFSKIRTGKGYMPSKRTALALAISLELDLQETKDLLARAGFALSHSQKFDVIVEYFILNRIYDLFLINDTLFQYDQPLLGG